MTRQKYNKPAIQEAIFEAKFSNDKYASTLPGQVFERLKNNYPKKKDMSLITLIIGSTSIPQSVSQPAQAPVMQAWKEDDSSLIQIGPQIAVANQLKYSSWENFIPNIRDVLEAYITLAEPKFISRLGVRYINRFLIVEENIDPSEYFNFGIQVPEAFHKTHSFDLSLIHKIDRSSINGLKFEVKTKFITDSLKAGEKGSSFILDIDCYINSEFTPNLNQIIKIVTEQHDIIEELFESIITNKSRNLMEVQ